MVAARTAAANCGWHPIRPERNLRRPVSYHEYEQSGHILQRLFRCAFAGALRAAARRQLSRGDTGRPSAEPRLVEPAECAGRTNGGGLAAALRLSNLSILLLDSEHRVLRHLLLEGRQLSEAHAQLADAVSEQIGRPAELRPTSYELPSHPIERGETFRAVTCELSGLSEWYARASGLLEEVRAQNLGASEVRLWPHHFDLATLISLGGEKTVGVGFSPGDASYAEPYWYVSPWPYPSRDRLAPLPADLLRRPRLARYRGRRRLLATRRRDQRQPGQLDSECAPDLVAQGPASHARSGRGG